MCQHWEKVPGCLRKEQLFCGALVEAHNTGYVVDQKGTRDLYWSLWNLSIPQVIKDAKPNPKMIQITMCICWILTHTCVSKIFIVVECIGSMATNDVQQNQRRKLKKEQVEAPPSHSLVGKVLACLRSNQPHCWVVGWQGELAVPDTEFLNSNASVSTFAGCIKAHHGWVALTPRCWVILLMTREWEAAEGIPLLKFKVSALH